MILTGTVKYLTDSDLAGTSGADSYWNWDVCSFLGAAESFGTVERIELHHFSDASQDAYGQCSYIRLLNSEKKAHCSLVLGKARVASIKHQTIPRLELAAASVSAKVSSFLRSELAYENMHEVYWTDSNVVLGYIQNESRRFHVYVANRVQQIREQTNPLSWCHVESRANPADDASRGLTPKQLMQESRWLKGPEFLWLDDDIEPEP